MVKASLRGFVRALPGWHGVFSCLVGLPTIDLLSVSLGLRYRVACNLHPRPRCNVRLTVATVQASAAVNDT